MAQPQFKMLKALLQLITSGAIVWFLALGTATAQVQVVTGDCGIAVQNIEAGATVNITQKVCGDQFRVSYLWLDGVSMSLVDQGLLTRSLEKAVGTEPRLLKLGVYDEVKKILDLGSERLSKHDDLGEGFNRFTSLETNIGNEFIDEYDDRATFDRSFNFFVGSEELVWADPKLIEDFYSSGAWPQNVFHCYPNVEREPYYLDELEFLAEDNEDQNLLAHVSRSTQMVAPISGREYRRYFRNIREEAKLLKSGLVHNFNMFEDEGITLEQTAVPPSYALHRYLTKTNFPDDYLHKYARFLEGSGCADGSGIMIRAYPRKVMFMVAVIEPISPSIAITQIGFGQDLGEGLRDDFSLRSAPKVDLNIPALVEGDSYILPLRIELRHGGEYDYLTEVSTPEQAQPFYDKLNEIRASHPHLNQVAPAQNLGAAATLLGLQPPVLVEPTSTYYFGDILALETLTTRNLATGDIKKHDVRDTPRLAMTTLAGYEIGSCPFLVFEDGAGQRTLHGRVLVGAVGPEKAMHETIAVPEGSESVLLEEREPEISTISKLQLRNLVTGAIFQIGNNITLMPKDTLRVAIPEEFRTNSVIEISGHYELLSGG